MFLVHRCHIVQPVEIRQVLKIGPAFHQLFGATVQQADMRVAAFDNLAVQLQHQTQNAMRCRVLRAEVDVEIADALLAGQRVSRAVIIGVHANIAVHDQPLMLSSHHPAGCTWHPPTVT
ncbi:MAG: hypothetical protein ACD_54C00003G0001 [uncultured bacterium]|nr:MAG: hypothetical protein ACD_54C00003G0001 [uncultured bacterium]